MGLVETTTVPHPPHYYPYAGGRYEVGPGLYRLATDLGNGPIDQRIVQIDREWSHYRANKIAARAERLGKYVCGELPEDCAEALLGPLVTSLIADYPQWFQLQPIANGILQLDCRLTDERLLFDPHYRLIEAHSAIDRPAYVSALDALACQIPEDLAVITIDASGEDRVRALHLCAPNHWAAEAKLGRGFSTAHAPVPGMARSLARQSELLDAVIHRGPFQRFAWGLATDRRLNHHPEPPPGEIDHSAWQGRRFDPDRPELYVRIERQCLFGAPEARAFLFTIRTYFEDVRTLDRERLLQLHAAIDSMSPAALQYKGLAGQVDEIRRWIVELSGNSG